MTVSNAYNRPEKLSADLRERILATAVELGYAGPNPAARSLRRGRAGALGVVLGETLPYAFEDPAAVEFLRGLALASADAAIALHLVPAAGQERDLALVLDAVVDGFVLFALPDGHPLIDPLIRRGLPLVVQGGPELPGRPLVTLDERTAAAAAMQHVLDLGHRRVGALTIPLGMPRRDGPVEAGAPATYRVSRERVTGYRAATAGRTGARLAVREVSLNSRERGEAAAGALLDGDEPPTAVVCMSDELAIGALRAAAARGLSVPGELSVVGWDDTVEAERAGLTTVHQSLRDQGRLCAELASSEPAEPAEPLVMLQPWELVVRGSTAVVPSS